MRKFIMLLNGLLFLVFASSLHASQLFLHSTAFNDKEKLAPIYTCEGKNISPELQWDHVPAKTATFTLIFSDPDAPFGTFYHWVLFNIPKTVLTLPENVSPLPAGMQVGKNSWYKAQYNGPCPPHGSSHRYIFTLYALDTRLALPDGTDVQSVQKAMHHHVLAIAEWKAVFGR